MLQGAFGARVKAFPGLWKRQPGPKVEERVPNEVSFFFEGFFAEGLVV